MPSQPPENVRALSITSDVAVISWSEPPRSTLNGVLKGYRIIFWSLYMDGGELVIGQWREGGAPATEVVGGPQGSAARARHWGRAILARPSSTGAFVAGSGQQ